MPNSFKDIAIIGMSGYFPQAETFEELDKNLSKGIDSVRKIPSRRLGLLGLDPDKEYIELGYLDNIDYFDHYFFNISLNEAECMDPQQRIALQLACSTIENAGYSLSQMKGSRTSTVLSAGDNGYKELLQNNSGVAFIGTTTSAIAGKISYYLDLHGPALMIDTSCSSSLVCVHEACMHLITGQADISLAGGINIKINIPEKHYLESEPLGIASLDGKSKSFDAKANGTGGAECAGFVLLKRLEDALRDKDNIHAIIKGSAINHDGKRSNSMAAPSPIAQTEVILAAWNSSDIDPSTITCIEAHGTGTKIGDPIEVQGLNDAFKKYTDKLSFCALSAVKSNIGHAGAAAGISSLIKAVLSIKHKKIYPLVHFSEPNPLIDFVNSAVYPVEGLRSWDSVFPRRIGVSAFGLSGTNSHIIIEEAASIQNENLENPPKEEYIVTLSAKTESALKNYIEKLKDYLLNVQYSISNIAFVLNSGRDDYDLKKAFVVSDKEDLINQISTASEWTFSTKAPKQRSLIFLCSGNATIEEGLTDLLINKYPAFKSYWNVCEAKADLSNNSVRTIAFQYSLYHTLLSLGLKPKHVFGTGLGNVTVEVVTGKISIDKALKKAELSSDLNNAFNKEGFIAVVNNLLKNDFPVFIEPGSHGILLEALKEINNNGIIAYPVVREQHSILQTLCSLYMLNIPIDWKTYYSDKKIYRIELPSYSFDTISCWPKVKLKAQAKDTVENVQEYSIVIDFSGTEIEKYLAQVWADLLKSTSFSIDDDFFDLGGNSLMGMQIITRIKEKYNVCIEFEDLYNYSTLRKLAEYIETKANTSSESPIASSPPLPAITSVERKGNMPLSYAQERMFLLFQQEPSASFYNMPATLLFNGKLDITALEKSICTILQRHEILRTIYGVENDGEPYQKVLENYMLSLKVIDLSYMSSENKRDNKALEIANIEAQKPFNLMEDIPFRAKLIVVTHSKYYFLVHMHHIAADGWSIGIFIRELSEIYRAYINRELPKLSKISIQYIDFGCWQKAQLEGETGQKQLEYWKKHLYGIPELLVFPTDKPRPARQSFNGENYIFEMSEELTNNIRSLCKHEGVTAFMLLISAYSLLLFRYSNQKDICIGTPTASRSCTETEKLIGYFSNTIVIRTQIDGKITYKDYLKQVKNIILHAFQNQDLPFERLVQHIVSNRNPALTPIFQYAFVLQNTSREVLDLPGLSVEFLNAESKGAKFDMFLSISEDGNIYRGMFEYNTDLFIKSTIEQLAGHYINLLDSITKYPEMSLISLPMITDEEKEKLIQSFNSMQEDYDF